jgi:hypothetical protein
VSVYPVSSIVIPSYNVALASAVATHPRVLRVTAVAAFFLLLLLLLWRRGHRRSS